MKKIIAVITALVLVLAAAGAALAEGTPKFTGGVEFNMNMDQVIQLLNRRNYEIDREHTRGPVDFDELEYEHFDEAIGLAADVTYLFVGNSLVAIRFDLEDYVTYEQALAKFTETFGQAVPFDAANLGNAQYAIDDDGDLRECRDMIIGNGFAVVLERDHDGEAQATILDTTAAYIKN